jgi:Cu2+-exporting ATPase
VERGGEAVKIKLEDLQSGETAIIKPGEKIPADGLVLEGLSYINESMLTGESVPVKRKRTERSSQALSMAMVR